MKCCKKLIETNKHDATARCNLGALINVLRLQPLYGKRPDRFFRYACSISLIAICNLDKRILYKFLIKSDKLNEGLVINLIFLLKRRAMRHILTRQYLSRIIKQRDQSAKYWSAHSFCESKARIGCIVYRESLLSQCIVFRPAIADRFDVKPRISTWSKTNTVPQRGKERRRRRRGRSPPEIRSSLSDELFPVHLTEGLARRRVFGFCLPLTSRNFEQRNGWGGRRGQRENRSPSYTSTRWRLFAKSFGPSSAGKRRRWIPTAETIRRN